MEPLELTVYAHVPLHYDDRQKFTMTVERPPIRRLSAKTWKEYDPGPRGRIIIEGEWEIVDRLVKALRPDLAKIKEEIG